ncbi:cold shock protein (beta-ribbon, CspA family) [Pseudomonas mucidolens]|uniref:Cold shock protein (Beta-ribbon, CspA family) n=1 Tax=Pseudomonas mucidolens TaxID=46679 RepID=A0A1H2M1V3_9PSED|nr:cold shock protein (beta-ribbon, CspA family) [Pseudomonas mucidolens]SQH34894.1 Uncharacterised protein [Pseudomonas mucidolens]
MVFRGRVKSYDQKTGVGSIALDEREEEVWVDLHGSGGVRLSVDLEVRFQMIHRPDGIYASGVQSINAT